MKNFFKYLRFSNIKWSIDLNPCVWSFRWHYQEPTQLDPFLHIQYVRILFLSVVVVIDNGVYKIWEEEIEVTEDADTKGDPL